MHNLYVKESHRIQGVGKQLFAHVVNHANEKNCNRIEFYVHSWNSARKFYEKMKGIDLTPSECSLYYCINKESIESICEANK